MTDERRPSGLKRDYSDMNYNPQSGNPPHYPPSANINMKIDRFRKERKSNESI